LINLALKNGKVRFGNSASDYFGKSLMAGKLQKRKFIRLRRNTPQLAGGSFISLSDKMPNHPKDFLLDY
jgi:hypothetical protein